MFGKVYIFKEDQERNSIKGKIRKLFRLEKEELADYRLVKLHDVERAMAIKVYEYYMVTNGTMGVFYEGGARNIAWDYFTAMPDVMDVIEIAEEIYGERYSFDRMYKEAIDMISPEAMPIF